MKNHLSHMAALLVLFVGALPCMSNAEQSHKEWIDIQSVSWSQHQPGAATRLADGKYRTAQGQFLIVANGKVAAKGPDYRTYRSGKPPGPAATTPRNVAAGNQQARTGLLLPAVQHAQAQDDAPAAGSRGFQPAPQAGIEPDEIDAAARSDTPVSASRFVLVVDGMEIAQFSGAIGIEAALKTRTRADIVLRRGLLRSPRLREWHEAANSGAASARKGGAIIVFDTIGQEVARYNFRNAWPSKWEGLGSRAGANEVAVESITITVERIEGS